MKKVLLTLLIVVLVAAGLGAVGVAGYRHGYAQGLQTASNGDSQPTVPNFGFDPNRMPMHGYGFDRDSGPGRGFDRGFPMMPGGRMGYGFFGPLMFLLPIAFWAFVIWAIYMLVTRSGWRLTRTAQPVDAQPAPTESETKE